MFKEEWPTKKAPDEIRDLIPAQGVVEVVPLLFLNTNSMGNGRIQARNNLPVYYFEQIGRTTGSLLYIIIKLTNFSLLGFQMYAFVQKGKNYEQ